MTAVREEQFAWVVERLETLGGIGEVKRQQHLDPILFPALHVFDGGHKVEEWGAVETRYSGQFTVEGYLEASDGAEAHAALNELYVRTVAVLLTEPPMGDLAETIDEAGMVVQVGPLFGKVRLSFSLDFITTFSTRRGDPSQAA